MVHKKNIFKVSSVALALSIGFTAVAPTSSAFAEENREVAVQPTFSPIVGDTVTFNKVSEIEHLSVVDNGGTFAGKADHFENIENYFKFDDNGKVVFDRDKALNELDFSVEEIDVLTRMTSEMTGMNNKFGIQQRGWVGITVKFGPEVRKMNGAAAGAFVLGFIGFKLKAMAAAGPWGAGAAGAISVFAAGAVGYAVSQGLKSVKLGKEIVGAGWSTTVTTP